jgi:alkylation response protein AidB-like acyl-CoA dehydrogenase
VAVTTLANERTLIGGGGGGVAFSDLVRLANQLGKDADPVLRQQMAQMYIRTQLLRYLGLRVQTSLSQGRLPGPESSIMKLALSRHLAETGDLVLALEGAFGVLADGSAPDEGFWQQQFLSQWASRIGGGTDQIQRNVIGERVLGLPGEPRTDKVLPFKELAGRK